MEDYVDQIEKYLRGQMNKQEELALKVALSSDENFHSLALSIIYILKSFRKTC